MSTSPEPPGPDDRPAPDEGWAPEGNGVGDRSVAEPTRRSWTHQSMPADAHRPDRSDDRDVGLGQRRAGLRLEAGSWIVVSS